MSNSITTDKPVILVVEDDATMRKAICAALNSQGYQVVAASDAEEALKIAGERSFDLVVTDVRMGALNGLDALEQTQRMQPGIGSLVVSGYTSEAETLRAVELSVDGYLKKPFRVAELLQRVDSILAEKRKKSIQAGQAEVLRRALWSSCQVLVDIVDRGGLVLPVGELSRRVKWLTQSAPPLRLSPDTVSEIALGVGLRLLDDKEPLEGPIKEGLRSFPLLGRIVSRQPIHAGGDSPEDRLLEQALAGPEPLESSPTRSTPEAVTPSPAVGHNDGLLVLAQALERGGDLVNARRAYQDALAGCGERRQRVQVLLGLARLAQVEGEADSLASLCKEAVEASQELNFGSQAHVHQEAGLLMAAQGEKAVGQRLLERAAGLFRGLEMQGEEAFTLIVLAILGQREVPPEHLVTLLYPEYSSRLRTLCESFLGSLLTGLRDPQLLSRLISRCQDAAQSLLPSLPLEARLVLAERASLLEQMGSHELVRQLRGDPDDVVRARAQRTPGEEFGPSTPSCELRSFGALEIFVGQHKVGEQQLKASKAKFMFAYLAAHGSASEDTLMDLFWGDQSSPRACLHKAVSSLRGVLEPMLATSLLVRESARIQINPEVQFWHDVSEFRQSVSLSANSPEAWDQLRRALVLYRGPYLDGCYYDWANQVRGELESNAAQASYQVAQLAILRNSPQLALEYAQRCLELDLMRQDALLLALKSHVALGRPAAAASLFEKHCARLKREYGVEPTMELLREYHAAKLGIA